MDFRLVASAPAAVPRFFDFCFWVSHAKLQSLGEWSCSLASVVSQHPVQKFPREQEYDSQVLALPLLMRYHVYAALAVELILHHYIAACYADKEESTDKPSLVAAVVFFACK